MPTQQNQDVRLKREVKRILENCAFDKLRLDSEVQVNFSGDKDDRGNYLPDKEIDVVARFSYRGKSVLLFFECTDSTSAKGVKREYREYSGDIQKIRDNEDNIRVLSSNDSIIKGRHFKDVDEVRLCFVYGDRLGEKDYHTCLKQAAPHSYLVWNFFALKYYSKISSVLGKWTQYELFRDFALSFEKDATFTLDALRIKQKGKTMYIGSIHPGQLLKIAYVVRRASERKYAYQRMLSKERIRDIADFISSNDPQSFLPNAIIIVFDNDRAIQDSLKYDHRNHRLTVPWVYCSAWMIDGQHRAYGFLDTKYEDWTPEKFEPFSLPVVIFENLSEVVQTQTFININYNQKKIKAGLLCDLTTLTKDLKHKLTWPSLIGQELNQDPSSPLHRRVKVSELHAGRPISLSSLVQYGLLETLLGYKRSGGNYTGPLFEYAAFDRNLPFDKPKNQQAFHRQVKLLLRFLVGVQKNTSRRDPEQDPWQNTKEYSLLRPTGINALFMLLAKILQRYPDAKIDFNNYLKPLSSVPFDREYVAEQGGGWKGFREFANVMIRKVNKGKRKNRLTLYGEKEKT